MRTQPNTSKHDATIAEANSIQIHHQLKLSPVYKHKLTSSPKRKRRDRNEQKQQKKWYQRKGKALPCHGNESGE
jgi:hypothetical protein